jgi:hypothetical protein
MRGRKTKVQTEDYIGDAAHSELITYRNSSNSRLAKPKQQPLKIFANQPNSQKGDLGSVW